MNRIIAIPSNGPELTDLISDHFGHCNYFVGIEIDDTNSYKKTFSIENRGHSGCMKPVMNLKERNVTDLVVGGIGGRPFLGFIQNGIKLYRGIPANLKENMESLLQGKLESLNEPICQGQSGHCHDL